MILHIEVEKFIYKQATVTSVESGDKILIEFEDGDGIEVYTPKIYFRMSHIGIEGFVREGTKFDFKRRTFDCYPTKPRSK